MVENEHNNIYVTRRWANHDMIFLLYLHGISNYFCVRFLVIAVQIWARVLIVLFNLETVTKEEITAQRNKFFHKLQETADLDTFTK